MLSPKKKEKEKKEKYISCYFYVIAEKKGKRKEICYFINLNNMFIG